MSTRKAPDAPPPAATAEEDARDPGVVSIKPYAIGTAARLAGIPPETLRIWERRYQLLLPGRTGGGHRLYSEDDVSLLRDVKRLVDSGMRIGAVAGLSHAQIRSEAARIGPAPTTVSERASPLIEEIIEAGRALDERRVAQLLDRPLMLTSGDEVVHSVYLPLLQRIGELWHAGRLSIGVEHFVEKMVTARIMAIFQSSPQPTGGQLALCACPPDERHEVGIFAAALTLKTGGFHVTVLGADLPAADLMSAIETTEPAVVVLAVTNQLSPNARASLSRVLDDERIACARYRGWRERRQPARCRPPPDHRREHDARPRGHRPPRRDLKRRGQCSVAPPHPERAPSTTSTHHDTHDDVTALLVDVFGMSPAFLLITAAVGFFGFVVSATFGIGGVVLLIPLLSMALPPAQAIAVSAPVMLVSNLGKTFVFRRHIDWRAAALVSGLALPAAYLSARLVTTVDDRVILVAVASLVLVSVAVDRLRPAGRAARTMSAPGLFAWGAVTGVISGLCGAAGPPTAIGLRGYGLAKEAFVGTVAIFAVWLQLAKLPAYIETDALPARLLPLAALLSVLAIVAVVIGPRLLRGVTEATFRVVIDALLVLSAVWLLGEAAFLR